MARLILTALWLANAVAVANTAGPHEIALTEAMKPRQWLSIFVLSSAAASPDGIGYLLSDDILALTAEATAPTDAENALPVVTASYSASNFSQQSGNYFVYRKDDSTLWVRPTRLAAHTLTITATPMGGGTGTPGQQSPGANAPNGLVREHLYRAVANSVGIGSVADPPDIWNATTEEFETDFSPWSRDVPTLTATQVLAVADGYSALDDTDVRQNSAWSKHFSLTEQYCVAIEDNSTYTLDSTVDHLRFVRSLLPTGWGVWQPIEDGSDGWITILSDYRTTIADPDSYHQISVVDYDAQYLREIEFQFETYGTITNNAIDNRGGKSMARYYRRGHAWSAKSVATNTDVTRGSYKLSYNDKRDLSIIAAQGPYLDDDLAGGLNAAIDLPPRRVAFWFHIIAAGTGSSQQNTIRSLTIGPHERANQKGVLSVRMR